MSQVESARDKLIAVHASGPYYDQAESADWLAPFWALGSPFLQLFNRLDLADAIDFACGRGRHTAQILDRAGRITLVDANASNIAACTERFALAPNVTCVVNPATSLPCATGAYSALFSYDAMIHFEATDVITLLGEFARVLRPGGRALLHYSNYQDDPTGSFADNPSWSAFFSEPMMLHFGSRVGLRKVASITGSLSRKANDGLTLFEKSSSCVRRVSHACVSDHGDPQPP